MEIRYNNTGYKRQKQQAPSNPKNRFPTVVKNNWVGAKQSVADQINRPTDIESRDWKRFIHWTRTLKISIFHNGCLKVARMKKRVDYARKSREPLNRNCPIPILSLFFTIWVLYWRKWIRKVRACFYWRQQTQLFVLIAFTMWTHF